ncbi:MAG: hypothetical protein XD69_0651 [Clostridia bacterium 62_21]|nr:MAG: hypothetical protein XD69_0651 [Clostridia bacterium 62_21]
MERWLLALILYGAIPLFMILGAILPSEDH